MSASHKQRYKNAALDSTEMRRRREEVGIQLRKNKREQQLFKRRNVVLEPATSSTSAGVESNTDNEQQVYFDQVWPDSIVLTISPFQCRLPTCTWLTAALAVKTRKLLEAGHSHP